MAALKQISPWYHSGGTLPSAQNYYKLPGGNLTPYRHGYRCPPLRVLRVEPSAEGYRLAVEEEGLAEMRRYLATGGTGPDRAVVQDGQYRVWLSLNGLSEHTFLNGRTFLCRLPDPAMEVPSIPIIRQTSVFLTEEEGGLPALPQPGSGGVGEARAQWTQENSLTHVIVRDLGETPSAYAGGFGIYATGPGHQILGTLYLQDSDLEHLTQISILTGSHPSALNGMTTFVFNFYNNFLEANLNFIQNAWFCLRRPNDLGGYDTFSMNMDGADTSDGEFYRKVPTEESSGGNVSAEELYQSVRNDDSVNLDFVVIDGRVPGFDKDTLTIVSQEELPEGPPDPDAQAPRVILDNTIPPAAATPHNPPAGATLGVPYLRFQSADPLGTYRLSWDAPLGPSGTPAEVHLYKVWQRVGGVWRLWGTTEKTSIAIDNVESSPDEGLPVHRDPFRGPLWTDGHPDSRIEGVHPTFTDDDAALYPPRNIPRQDFHPATTGFHGQRQVYAGSEAEPLRLHWSEAGVFESFAVSVPPADNDSFSKRVASETAERIRHVVTKGDLLVFTDRREYRVTTDGAAVTSDTVSVVPESSFGSSWLRPVLARDHVILFDREGSSIIGLRYDFASNSLNPDDLSAFSKDILRGRRITARAYVEGGGTPQVFLAADDGTVLVLSLFLEFDVYGWWTIQTSRSGRVRSMAPIRDGNGKVKLHLSVERGPSGGEEFSHEVMEVEGDTGCLLDNHVAREPTASPDRETKCIVGLHHDTGTGASVAHAGGWTDARVSPTGTIEVHNVEGINSFCAGESYEAVLETLDLLPAGPEGDLFSHARRNIRRVTVETASPRSVELGRSGRGTRTTEGGRFSDDGRQVEVQLPTYHDYSSGVVVRQNAPEPLGLRALVAEVECDEVESRLA